MDIVFYLRDIFGQTTLEIKNKINKNNIIIFFFILLFFVFPQLKILNLKINVFDTGIYLSNLSNMIHHQNYTGIYNGHFQPCLYIISKILKLNFNYADNILLFLQSLFLVSPILFLKQVSCKLTFFYIIFLPMWLINLNGFHVDSLIVLPLLIFLFSSDYKVKFISAFTFVLIKEIYFILSFFCMIYIFLKTKDKKLKYISICCSIIILLTFFYLIFFLIPMNSASVTYIEGGNLKEETGALDIIKIIIFKFTSLNYSKLLYFPSIFIFSFFLPLLKKDFYFFYIPFFLIYLIVPNDNLFKFNHHYSLVIIPLIIFFSYQSKFFEKLVKKKIMFNFCCLFFILLNPLNFNLFTNYDYKNLIEFNNYKEINKLIENKKNNSEKIIATNNFINHKYIFKKSIVMVSDIHDNLFLQNEVLCSTLTEMQKQTSKKTNKKICKIFADEIIFHKKFIQSLTSNKLDILNKNYISTTETKNFKHYEKIN